MTLRMPSDSPAAIRTSPLSSLPFESINSALVLSTKDKISSARILRSSPSSVISTPRAVRTNNCAFNSSSKALSAREMFG